MALAGDAAGVVRGLADGERKGAYWRVHGTTVIAVISLLILAFVALHAPGRDFALSMFSGLAVAAAPLLRRSADLVQLAGVRAPALALGLGVAALAIPMAVLAWLLRWSLRVPHADANPRSMALAPSVDRPDDTTGFARPRRAWIEGKLDGAEFRRDLKPGLTRIGRESDNEIAIATAHKLERYHAAIEHTWEYDIYICDLTNGANERVRVNGRCCARRRLRDGDRVSCPGIAFTFRIAST